MNKQILKHVVRYILMILILLVCIKIFNLSSQDGTVSKGTSNSTTRNIVLLLNKNISDIDLNKKVETYDPIIRKVAHCSIYGLLGILLMCCMITFSISKRKQLLISLGLIFLYACSDEIHQRFVPGRSGEFTDVGIDTLGALIGIIFVLLIVLIVQKMINLKRSKVKALEETNRTNPKKRKIIFIASTGGHLNELMQVKSLFEKYEYHIITEKTEVDESLKEEYGNRMRFLIYGTKKHPIRYLFKFAVNSLISLIYFFKYCPEIVVTTGTHTAVPMCYIAKIFGSKVIFIETFANRTTGTLAGKLVYPIADVFVVQWEEMHDIYPKSVCWGWLY